jgi:hypothetical protein
MAGFWLNPKDSRAMAGNAAGIGGLLFYCD